MAQMIKRISMWKLKPECGETELATMRRMLESLPAKINAIESVEVGINVSTSESSFDIVFSATFQNASALKEFESHPFHREVGKYVDSLKARRYVVDYVV